MAMGLLPLEELTSAQRQFSERAAAIQRAVRTRELVGSLIKEARSVLGAWYEEVDGALVQLLAARDAGEDFSPGVKQLWGLLTPVAQLSSEGIRVLSAAQAEGRPNRTAQAEALAHFRWALEECVALMRTVLVGWPELDLEVPPEVADEIRTIRISWWAYLRAVANLAWSCIRHPFRETTIDLSTGRVLYHS